MHELRKARICANMNLFGGKTKKDEQRDLREKLLRELRQNFPAIKRPNNDDTLFEILFLSSGEYQKLRIFIQTEFPAVKPGIFFVEK